MGTQRVKRRIFSGTVCEQIVYPVSGRTERPLDAKPCLRFRDEEERRRHRDRMAEQRFCRLVNANFDTSCYYGTLTLDAQNEVHDFDDALRLMRNYARRVLRLHPDALLLLVCGRGKTTSRVHYHLIARGVPVSYIRSATGGVSVESDLIRKWGLGDVQLRPLRAHNTYGGLDCGTDYTGLARYLLGHWTPEQGGQRYHIYGRDVRHCDREDAAECREHYSPARPPRPPKAPDGWRWQYVPDETRVTDFGYQYYKYVLLPQTGVHGRRTVVPVF